MEKKPNKNFCRTYVSFLCHNDYESKYQSCCSHLRTTRKKNLKDFCDASRNVFLVSGSNCVYDFVSENESVICIVPFRTFLYIFDYGMYVAYYDHDGHAISLQNDSHVNGSGFLNDWLVVYAACSSFHSIYILLNENENVNG